MAIISDVITLKNGSKINLNRKSEINADFTKIRIDSIGTDLFKDLNHIGDKQIFSSGAYFEVVSSRLYADNRTIGVKMFDAKGNVLEGGSTVSIKREDASGNRIDYYFTALGKNGVTIPDGILCDYPYKEEQFLHPRRKIDAIRHIITKPFPFGQWLEPSLGTYWNEYGIDRFAPSDELINFLTSDYVTTEEIYSGEDTGEDSGHGGQDGSGDNSSDAIAIPNLPTISASSCGLVDMYKLTLEQTKQLANFLWSNFTEFSENVKKIFSEPMDAIISLSLSPINPDTGNDTEIKIANINSGVSGKKILNQYVTLDCGTINIPLYWGSALDFSPYTKATIYLPLIGNQVINIDDIMGKSVSVKYNIDLLTGSCVAFIICNDSVMYSYSGNVISQLPLSGKNALDIYKALITSVVNTGLAIGTGGASIGAQSIATLSSSGINVLGSKESVQRGGQITSTAGMLGVKYPIITILRAEQSRPKEFKTFKGYPSNLYERISELSGYTEIEYIHLDGINALDSEKEELEQLLKTGVIF